MITAGRVIQMEDAKGFPVAVKRWNKQDSDKAEWEQKMLRLVSGEGIPEFIRCYEDAENIYMVTEWINGVTLDVYVEEAGGFLERQEALSLGGRILNLLRKFHHSKEGCLVYTDLKPSNVMVKEGNVWLVDFESVLPAGDGERFYDENTVVMGTRPFTAPEFFTGRISPSCDYYSLGVLMYYMMTGELWFGDKARLPSGETGEGICELLDSEPEKRSAGLRIFSEDRYDETVTPPVLKVAERGISFNEPKVFFIHDNPRFAMELAYIAAAHMDLKVGIFTVWERDNYYMLKGFDMEIPVDRYPFVNTDEEGAGRFLSQADLQQWLNEGYVMPADCCGNLFLGTIQPSDICRLLPNEERWLFVKNMKQIFDVTLILGEMMRDYISLDCDHIIAAVTPDLWESHRVASEAFDFQDCLGFGRVSHVAWEFKEGVSMSVERFMRFFDKEHYLGEIYYDSNRHIIENRGQLPYCFGMPEVIKQQYQRIIAKLMYQQGGCSNEK